MVNLLPVWHCLSTNKIKKYLFQKIDFQGNILSNIFCCAWNFHFSVIQKNSPVIFLPSHTNSAIDEYSNNSNDNNNSNNNENSNYSKSNNNNTSKNDDNKSFGNYNSLKTYDWSCVPLIQASL